MRVDLKATRHMWKQTVIGSLLALIGIAALIIYFSVSAEKDAEAVRLLVAIFALIPAGLGVAYLIRRFIERSARN
jgi:uncharacterized membrane protein (GlpM family)